MIMTQICKVCADNLAYDEGIYTYTILIRDIANVIFGFGYEEAQGNGDENHLKVHGYVLFGAGNFRYM